MGLFAGRLGARALRRVGLGACVIVIAAAPSASANTSGHPAASSQGSSGSAQRVHHPDPSTCAAPVLSQPFLGSGDFNYYGAAPGPSSTAPDGSSWTLSRGARIISTQLADGTAGAVLSLPAGSQAVSPDVCVTSVTNPLARAMLRNISGGGGLEVSVSYYTTGGWTKPQSAGTAGGGTPGGGWAVSSTINIPPAPAGQGTGWQILRFTFTVPRGANQLQMYGLNVAYPPPVPSTGACSTPVLSQAFLPAGDTNYYTPAPGQTGGGFVGTGWTLTGAAKIVTTTRADGTTGYVLDLPSGSMAVSPNICVTSLYPMARMMVRSLFGGDDLSFRVSYWNNNAWTPPHETGHVQGNLKSWTLSNPVQLQPADSPGWQIVRLTLLPNGSHSEFQIYNLELDPYAKG